MDHYLDATELTAALALPDLTDPANGPHAVALLLQRIVASLAATWSCPVITIREPPLVSVADNYDRLGFAAEDVTRERRYSRYASPTVMLRSHTTAAIPHALEVWDRAQHDGLIVAPGLVYRRDSIDRTHVGAPHQADLWRVVKGRSYGLAEVAAMAETVAEAVSPGTRWRLVERDHPYTRHGRQLDVAAPGPDGEQWLELAECGVISPRLLADAGLNPDYWTGLALGIGLDRAVMITKGIDDIRLLRSPEPRVAAQLRDLATYRPVSHQPAVRRDLSIVAEREADAEVLGDRARRALGERATDLEELVVVARTPYAALPDAARERLGLAPDQDNLLVRLTLRPLVGTLTDAAANQLRDQVYRAVHAGPVLELAAG